LTLLDVRNSIGQGITVSGQAGEVATLTNDSTGDSFVVLASNDSLTAERILAVANGLSLTDNGPEQTVVIGIVLNGINFNRLQQISTSQFLGRITAATGDIEQLTGTQATTLLDAATTALQGVVKQSTAVTDLNQTIVGPTIAEVQAISDKVDELLGVMRTSGQLA